MNSNSDFIVNPQRNDPVIPLPNPGEGGPVGGGNGNPVIPLPNPGEGGPVGGGNGNPVIPLPNPGEGGPVNGGNGSTPVIPLPNPGEGGPVFPGNRPNIPPIISTIITVHPRPNIPCNFCVSPNGPNGRVRFLNAASDYNPFMVYINNSLFSKSLAYAELTEYERVASGMQTISILGEDGYIYVQKPVNIPQNGIITIAIINTETGLDITVISDVPCSRPANTSCIRTCNLSYNSGPLNVVIGDRYITFPNVRFQQTTDYMSIWPGRYGYFVSRTVPNTTVLISSIVNIQTRSSYTIYIFNWNAASPEAIRALIVEEQR